MSLGVIEYRIMAENLNEIWKKKIKEALIDGSKDKWRTNLEILKRKRI